MSNNPLMLTKPPSLDLEGFIARANLNRFVIDSGKPYFIATRINASGETERYGARNA